MGWGFHFPGQLTSFNVSCITREIISPVIRMYTTIRPSIYNLQRSKYRQKKSNILTTSTDKVYRKNKSIALLMMTYNIGVTGRVIYTASVRALLRRLILDETLRSMVRSPISTMRPPRTSGLTFIQCQYTTGLGRGCRGEGVPW